MIGNSAGWSWGWKPITRRPVCRGATASPMAASQRSSITSSTLRARFGLPINGVMPYLTGGIAYGRNRIQVNDEDGAIRIRKDHFGWTVGAGVEARLEAGWSVRAEYLYADFGRRMYNQVIIDGNDTTEFSTSAKPATHIVRIGVNYRF